MTLYKLEYLLLCSLSLDELSSSDEFGNEKICNCLRPVGSNYRLGGGTHKFFRLGGAHIFFFKMTDLCNEQYSIFVQIIGGGTAPVPPPIPTALCLHLWMKRFACVIIHNDVEFLTAITGYTVANL